MNRQKENAVNEFIQMIRKSWTYDRLTDKERSRLMDAFVFAANSAIKGTFEQRWAVLHVVYNSFLMGVGYNGPGWREPYPEEVTAF